MTRRPGPQDFTLAANRLRWSPGEVAVARPTVPAEPALRSPVKSVRSSFRRVRSSRRQLAGQNSSPHFRHGRENENLSKPPRRAEATKLPANPRLGKACLLYVVRNAIPEALSTGMNCPVKVRAPVVLFMLNTVAEELLLCKTYMKFPDGSIAKKRG